MGNSPQIAIPFEGLVILTAVIEPRSKGGHREDVGGNEVYRKRDSFRTTHMGVEAKAAENKFGHQPLLRVTRMENNGLYVLSEEEIGIVEGD